MTTHRFERHCLMALVFVLPLLLLLPACSTLAAKAPPPDLLVKINLPFDWPENSAPLGLNAAYILEQKSSWNQYDMRLRRAFLRRLASVFKAKGYPGQLALIDTVTTSAKGLPILVIDLSRWNASNPAEGGIAGPFECTFKAKLVTVHEEIFLAGVDYRDPFAGNGIEHATDVAIAEFHAKLVEYVKLGLLPGGS